MFSGKLSFLRAANLQLTRRKPAITFARSLSSSASWLTNNSKPHPPDWLSNEQMSFPCLDRNQQKTESLRGSSGAKNGNNEKKLGEGPEPIYSRVLSGFEVYHSKDPLFLDYGSVLPEFTIAYETWGQLNHDKSNAILLHTGLSASSHAKSQPKNPKPGWWENFIGPGKPLDTDKYFIICTNIIGGCYGSTGPSSVHPQDKLKRRYATRFPIISVSDMTRAQHRLVKEHFSINKLYAAVGCSLGGMQSFAYAAEFPSEVNKVVSVSGCTRSHPYSIAMRFSQRQIVMNDANWNRGFYYNDGPVEEGNTVERKVPPHAGMKLARAVATITYRSGPEWESRFARARLNEQYKPAFCADFLVETYLDHQGDKFSLEYDPNSFLYISKAMDMFDLGHANRSRAARARHQIEQIYNDPQQLNPLRLEFKAMGSNDLECLSIPTNEAYKQAKHRQVQFSKDEARTDLRKGLSQISGLDTLVIGVKSDILFPSWQQREAYELLAENQRLNGKSDTNVKHIELSEEISQYGHDTFLLDVANIGQPIKDFLG